jgi:hypothetical protein
MKRVGGETEFEGGFGGAVVILLCPPNHFFDPVWP